MSICQLCPLLPSSALFLLSPIHCGSCSLGHLTLPCQSILIGAGSGTPVLVSVGREVPQLLCFSSPAHPWFLVRTSLQDSYSVYQTAVLSACLPPKPVYPTLAMVGQDLPLQTRPRSVYSSLFSPVPVCFACLLCLALSSVYHVYDMYSSQKSWSPCCFLHIFMCLPRGPFGST